MSKRLPVFLLLLAAVPCGTPAPLAAQKTGDQARLVFTVSGGYAFGRDLWSVGAQPVIIDGLDLYGLERNLRGTWTAELGATYYRSPNLGFTFDLGFIDIATKDSCTLLSNSGSIYSDEICSSINGATYSALSTSLAVGVILRAASRQVVSPYLRVQGGILLVSRSTTELTGYYVNPDLEEVLVPIYPSEGSSSVSGALAVGVGVTIPIAKAYHLRLEGRANTFGLQVVDGPTDFQGIVPPTSTRYLTQFSILAGIDLVLEKKHGRRY
jgi:hypothetical protein